MRERQWWTRLRWRLRGATMWPAFLLALVVDALLLHFLPIAGDRGPSLFPALLLAGFFNLAVVAVGAPLAGTVLRRRRPGLPRVVADDRAGTVLLGCLALALLAVGLAHRPTVQAEAREFERQAASARRYIAAVAGRPFHDNLDRMDSVKHGPDLYRTCVPGDDPRRAFCVIVTTDQDPPGVTRDPDQRPNATVSGPDNPARQGG
jgi:hypothetical protein